MDFYIMQDLMKRGPFTLEELRQRGITPETLVQQNGSQQWATAGSIPELATLFVAPQAPVSQPVQPTVAPQAPPPTPAAPSATQAMPQAEPQRPVVNPQPAPSATQAMPQTDAEETQMPYTQPQQPQQTYAQPQQTYTQQQAYQQQQQVYTQQQASQQQPYGQQQQQQQAYGQQQAYITPVPDYKTSSIIMLVVGILSCCCCMFNIPLIVFGILAMSNNNKAQEYARSGQNEMALSTAANAKKMLMWGLIGGIVWIVLSGVVSLIISSANGDIQETIDILMKNS